MVRTSLLLARAQLRHGWRGLVGIALLVALVSALVLAGLAGAQRTRTAVDRMIVATDASDVTVNPDNGDDSKLDFDAVAALPMVAKFSRVQGVGMFGPGPYKTFDDLFSSPFTAASDGKAIFKFDRPVLRSGRVPAVDSTDEVYIDRSFAERSGLGVGDSIDTRVFPTATLAKAQDQASAGDGDGALAMLSQSGTLVQLRIAGIGSTIEGVAIDEGYEPIAVWMGPGVYEQLGKPSAGYGGAVVKLRSPSDVEAFKSAVSAMVPDELIVYQTLGVTRAKALRATQPAAAALAIFAAVAALLGVLIIGQAMSRRLQLDARDNRTLAALGTTQGERFVTSMIRLSLAALVGVAAGIAIAFGLSVFTPVGPARIAEPNLGLHFNGAILLPAAVVLLVAVLLVALLPAWHNARETDPVTALRGSKVAGWLAVQGASPPMTTGVRFGLEPGRGRTAVPTRATIIGALTAVAVAAATIVFASSLDRVVNDGRFYGSNFDVAIDWGSSDTTTADQYDAALARVAADPAVAGVADMRITEIRVNGQPVTTLAFRSSSNTPAVEPTIGAGRAPTAADEIALGATTLRDLGVGIGDTVAVKSAGFTGDARVVGRAVLPGVGLYSGSDRTSIGVGGIISPEALPPRDSATKSFVVADLNSSADIAQFEQRVSQMPLAGVGDGVHFQENSRPSDIQGLARLKSLPVVLAGVLVVLVSVTVIHAMVVAVRRRRRDIAILQALGSTRGAVTAIGVWQGITIGVAALLFGVPLGIVAGRWLWTLLANGFGTLAEPVVPLAYIGALVVAVLVLAAAAGVVPIRRGLRHHPAEVLRSE